MARQTTPLNPTQVSQAKPKEKVYNLFDGQGLILRVKPNGAKLWIFNYYKPFTKKRTDISLGQYPSVGLSDARDKRQEFLSLLAKDIDPKSHRDEQQRIRAETASTTFEYVAQKWMAIHRTKVKEHTAAKIWRSLEKDAFPKLGALPIEQISAPLALTVINGITKRQSLEVARKVARRLNNIMTFAVNSGLVHHNPLNGIKEMIPTAKVINRPSLSPEELPGLMRTLNYANIRRVTRCLIEWQLHTMVRPSEAAGAKWSEIDFDAEVWAIPAERMKMERDFIIPLTKQTLALLEFMKPLSGHREHIFPSYLDERKPANNSTANMALKRMGFHGRQTAHGLRSLASTTLNEQGFDKDIVETALAHSDRDQIRGAYNRATYLERRRVMMSWWSEHIEHAATGNMSLANANKALRLVNE